MPHTPSSHEWEPLSSHTLPMVIIFSPSTSGAGHRLGAGLDAPVVLIPFYSHHDLWKEEASIILG